MRIVGAALGSMLLCAPVAARAYVEDPPPNRDGGGTLTCRECHIHDEAFATTGEISLHGLPDRFEMGRSYPLMLHRSHPGMKGGGFQLSVRNTSKHQSGWLSGADETIVVTSDAESGITFAQHSEEGAGFVNDGKARWPFVWTAPMELSNVMFYAAGNASNGDDSALGDVILLFSRAVEVAH